jgi:hypothetical protein
LVKYVLGYAGVPWFQQADKVDDVDDPGVGVSFFETLCLSMNEKRVHITAKPIIINMLDLIYFVSVDGIL